MAAPGDNADICFRLAPPPIANDGSVARRFLKSVRDERAERNLAAWHEREDRKTAIGPFESGVNHGRTGGKLSGSIPHARSSACGTKIRPLRSLISASQVKQRHATARFRGYR